MGVDTNYAASAEAADLTASWRDEAACHGLGSLMDPPRDYADTVAELDALAVCRWRCPVLDDCRSWVLSLPERHDPGGVCGGLTERDRTHARNVAGGHKAAATMAASAPGSKECGSCGVVKDATEFYANTGHRDGLGSNCIVCHRAAATAARKRKRHGQGERLIQCGQCRENLPPEAFPSDTRTGPVEICRDCRVTFSRPAEPVKESA